MSFRQDIINQQKFLRNISLRFCFSGERGPRCKEGFSLFWNLEYILKFDKKINNMTVIEYARLRETIWNLSQIEVLIN